MIRLFAIVLAMLFIISCKQQDLRMPDETLLAARGKKFDTDFRQIANDFLHLAKKDSNNTTAWLGHTEMQIMRYIFGLNSRENTLPTARSSFEQAWKIDSIGGASLTVAGMLHFLDWNWTQARSSFEQAIAADPENPKSRHWYSLLLCALDADFEEALLQSDTIMQLDQSGDYQVGRGSLMYFARRNEELRDLMLGTIEMDPKTPWGYDWLGMAYVELKDFDKSIETYYQAFELSDGLVEVGGGLGHALGLAGQYKPAKLMADRYSEASNEHYLPPVQRAFIHIGIAEYEEALRLLEQAYEEKSWFIIFMKIEPWYDPIKEDPRFKRIFSQMNFPS